MNDTYHELINRRAYYRGNDRAWYMHPDTQYKIIEVRQDGKAVMFDNGEWVGIAKIEIVEQAEPNSDLLNIDDVFTKASGGKEAVLDAEIARLETRLAKLRTAREVLDSL